MKPMQWRTPSPPSLATSSASVDVTPRHSIIALPIFVINVDGVTVIIICASILIIVIIAGTIIVITAIAVSVTPPELSNIAW